MDQVHHGHTLRVDRALVARQGHHWELHNPSLPPRPSFLSRCYPHSRQWTQAVFSSFQLTLTIRTLLKNLKVKIDTLKDLLLRAVSTRQMYPCKHVHLPWREEKQSYLREEGIWATHIFPQFKEDLVSTLLPIVLNSVWVSVHCFAVTVLAREDSPKEWICLGVTLTGQEANALPQRSQSCALLFTVLRMASRYFNRRTSMIILNSDSLADFPEHFGFLETGSQ